jgi:endonuclease/exonuclease/phosphatase family metal-dependent hydrolase
MQNMNQNLDNSLVVLYTDLNIDALSPTFQTFKTRTRQYGWLILVPDTTTRKGYGNHRDSTIDYIIINNKNLINIEMTKRSLKVIKDRDYSDHHPLSFSLYFK